MEGVEVEEEVGVAVSVVVVEAVWVIVLLAVPNGVLDRLVVAVRLARLGVGLAEYVPETLGVEVCDLVWDAV
jgi:hypothetical protein